MEKFICIPRISPNWGLKFPAINTVMSNNITATIPIKIKFGEKITIPPHATPPVDKRQHTSCGLQN